MCRQHFIFYVVTRRAQQLEKGHAKKQNTHQLRKHLRHFENIWPEKTHNTTKHINTVDITHSGKKISPNTESKSVSRGLFNAEHSLDKLVPAVFWLTYHRFTFCFGLPQSNCLMHRDPNASSKEMARPSLPLIGLLWPFYLNPNQSSLLMSKK